MDGGCFSACEDFLIPYKDNHRATIVGKQTSGSTDQPFTKEFGNGMLVSLSMRRVSMPDGSNFEGVGIIPDVEVLSTAADLRSSSAPGSRRYTLSYKRPGRRGDLRRVRKYLSLFRDNPRECSFRDPHTFFHGNDPVAIKTGQLSHDSAGPENLYCVNPRMWS
jgi:hypothetical protein